jgi:hypothetical protein
MNVRMKNGKPVSPAILYSLETSLDLSISSSFKEFLKNFDGADPELNIFKVADDNDCSVNNFIPAEKIAHERKCIPNLPVKAYPIAWCEGGNYIFIDEREDGAVFFWDHELVHRTVKIAKSFGDFLDLLQPFDAKSIQLKPGQVKEVWVDPKIMSQLKKDNR